ncbi:MAG: RNA polymerase sigma factor [Gemmataceae bacterium]
MRFREAKRFLDFLHRQTAAETVPDGELLDRYARTGDQPAFELLVRRHGAMVLGVARRVLRDSHSAEDAFQATFLALARKAGSFRRTDSAGGWLYRVAVRAALKARPKRVIAAAAPSSSVQPSTEVEWSELRSILDEEVSRLPDRFRSAIVLCYLAGKSTEEAAQSLDCPRGTVLSRLAAARERLRRALTRRGFGVSAALLTTGLASEAGSASVGSSLIALALQVIGPTTAIAPAVVTLTEGVLHAMFMSKVKVAAVMLVAAGMLGLGVGQLAGPGDAAARQQAPPLTSNAQDSLPRKKDFVDVLNPTPEEIAAFEKSVVGEILQIVDSDSTEVKLEKSKFQCAQREFKLRMAEYRVGRGTLDILLASSRRLRDAALDLASNQAQRVQARQRFYSVARMMFDLNQARFDMGGLTEQDLEETRFEMLDATLQLLRAEKAR